MKRLGTLTTALVVVGDDRGSEWESKRGIAHSHLQRGHNVLRGQPGAQALEHGEHALAVRCGGRGKWGVRVGGQSTRTRQERVLCALV